MSYSVETSRTSEKDLHAAVGYIINQLKNPIAGRRLLANAIASIESLSEFPSRFPVVDEPLLAMYQIHFVAVQNYLLFYQVHESSQTVIVLRFLYGKSDWVSILRTDFPAS